MTRKKRNTSMQPHAAVATLEDSHWSHWRARQRALETLGKLEPTTLALYADAVVARLEDGFWNVQYWALKTLRMLEPATLAQYADAVVPRLEDFEWRVRKMALETLAKLEPTTLAQHAEAVVAKLEDSEWDVREVALETLAKLEPATLTQYAGVVLARLEDRCGRVRRVAYHALEMLPRYVRYATRGVDCNDLQSRSRALNHGQVEELRSRLLGRIKWYRCRIRLRVRSLSLYWYALPYRPSGPGHARDVEAWNHISTVRTDVHTAE